MSDYGVMTAADTLRIERELPGPIERIWSYLTDPEKRGRWLAGGPMELRGGGKADLLFRNNDLSGHTETPPAKYAEHADGVSMEVRVLECDAPRLLVLSWNDRDGEGSEVRFELSERRETVLLTLTHSRLRSREETVSVAAGWHTHLDILAARLEGRAPEKFWPAHARLEAAYEERVPAR